MKADVARWRQFHDAHIPWAAVEGRKLVLFHAIKK
jgi:hypothetical protein